MGKTKTALIGGLPEEKKAGKEAYEEKRLKKEEARKKAEEEKEKQSIKKVGLKGGERIKTVEAGPIIQEKPEEEAEKVERKPRIRGKKYKIAKAKVDKTKFYPISEAIKLIKETSYGKFDASIELHLVVKKQGLNINVSLPHSFGKAKKVEICGEKTLKKLEKGIVDFDVLLATPEMMPKLVPYAKILGPKGLMPNPKTGTLIKDKKDADKFSSGTISVKTEKKAPLIHQTIGKVSQNNKELEENMVVLIDTISAKQISKAYLSSSMSPSVKLQL